MPKTSIHLWPDHQALADRLVASGRFEDIDEVVAHAFALLEDEVAAQNARLVKLTALIEQSIADGEAGRTIPAEEVFAKLRRKVATHHRKQDAAE